MLGAEQARDITDYIIGNGGTAVVSALLGFLGAVSVFRSKFDVGDTKLKQLEQIVDERRKADLVLIQTQAAHDKELVNRQITELTNEVREQCKRSDEYYNRIERRQRVTLEIVAAIASKNNVNHRALGADVLTRALAGELDEEITDALKRG